MSEILFVWIDPCCLFEEKSLNSFFVALSVFAKEIIKHALTNICVIASVVFVFQLRVCITGAQSPHSAENNQCERKVITSFLKAKSGVSNGGQ